MKALISEHYQIYLDFLRELTGRPSVFTNPEDVEHTIHYCRSVFERNLSGYRIRRDEGKNLIARPEHMDHEKDIVYLSAHVDTVGALPSEWDAPFQPFSVFEDRCDMVGRGVSDCKAGVALQLFVSELAKKGEVSLSNVIFTITFKEEGAGEKTSVAIGRNLGSRLPVGPGDTYLIVLENNVTVGDIPTLCIYTSEKGNFVIRTEGTPLQLKAVLARLGRWNPVGIFPKGNTDGMAWTTLEQKGGHACSVPREENRLTDLLLEAGELDVLKAGEETNFAVIPTKIFKACAGNPVVHTLLLSNRSFDTLGEVRAQLEGIAHTEVKDFSISQGLDGNEKISRNKISSLMAACESPELKIRYTYNIGASDATIINNAMDPGLLENFYSIIMGPGSRSQRDLTPPRLTHGKNETFHKKSGEIASGYILALLEKVGCITRNPV